MVVQAFFDGLRSKIDSVGIPNLAKIAVFMGYFNGKGQNSDFDQIRSTNRVPFGSQIIVRSLKNHKNVRNIFRTIQTSNMNVILIVWDHLNHHSKKGERTRILGG